MLNDIAVESSHEQVGPDSILGQNGPLSFDVLFEKVELTLDQTNVVAVSKVEAIPQVYNGSDNRRVVKMLICPLPGPPVVLLPKVNTTAEPIIVVRARIEVSPTRDNFISDAPIASVETENEIRQFAVHAMQV